MRTEFNAAIARRAMCISISWNATMCLDVQFSTMHSIHSIYVILTYLGISFDSWNIKNKHHFKSFRWISLYHCFSWISINSYHIKSTIANFRYVWLNSMQHYVFIAFVYTQVDFSVTLFLSDVSDSATIQQFRVEFTHLYS